MVLTKIIEHVLVGILGSMDAAAHNAKHDKRKRVKCTRGPSTCKGVSLRSINSENVFLGP
jgi:hypothetical protein